MYFYLYMIIHITSIPGTGQTTQYKKIKKIFNNNNTKVYDIDNFFSNKDLNHIYNHNDINVRVNRWKTHIRNKLLKTIQHKNTILIGDLHKHSPNNKPFNIKVDHKIFIDVSMKDAVKRYFTRAYKNIQNNKFLNDIVNYENEIPSTIEYKREIEQYKKWSKINKYKNINENKLIEHIKYLLK